MNHWNSLKSDLVREARFMGRDRAVLVWMFVVLLLSSVAVSSGLEEVQYQKATVEHLLEADEQDRTAEFLKQEDWGAAAYYSFHFTYDMPSNFAFAAMGQRDLAPWKHRVRMLAIEGQIHERDAGNPALALIGRFDFAFLAALVLPMVLIVLMHDLRASERVAGRYDLLVATSGVGAALWRIRALLRSGGIVVCALIPLLIAGIFNSTSFSTLLAASAMVLVYVLFWTLVCLWFAAWQRSASVILATLIGIWVLLSAIVPAVGRITIDRLVPIPSGAEILMTQREAVNDAWDLPKEATMTPFVERHPELSDHVEIERPFEWKWYYAFQQVGDQKTEALSAAYTEGRLRRDQMAAGLAFLAPPALLERALQNLAKTDVGAAIDYEKRVRAFHAELREFYYPRLFPEKPFSKAALEQLPVFGGEEVD